LSILRKSTISLQSTRYTTKDYIKLNSKAFLYEYQITYNGYRCIAPISPFKNWQSSDPTKSLDWYDAYNKTKHDRETSFCEAKLKHVLSSIAANIILHCVRFSPYGLYNNITTLSGYINQMVNIAIVNSDIKTFYIPLITLPDDAREDLFIYDSYRSGNNQPWVQNNLIL